MQTILYLQGADIPPDHTLSKACQYVLACFNDEELCRKIASSTNYEICSHGSLLQLLSFHNWVRRLATLDKDKDDGLAAINELMAQLPTITKGHLTGLTSFSQLG